MAIDRFLHKNTIAIEEQGMEQHAAPSSWEEWSPLAGQFMEQSQVSQFRYSPHADIFYLYHGTLEPGFTVEGDGSFAWRVSHDRQRVVAIEIHNFESVFLKMHPELARTWKRSHNPLLRFMPNMQARRKQIITDKVRDATPAQWHMHHYAHV